MKSFVVLALFVALAAAKPATPDADAQIIELVADNIGLDKYSYGYKTSNGISANEDGQLTNPGAENEGIAVRGQFTYTGDDGVVYTVTYTADERGFLASGAHIPQN